LNRHGGERVDSEILAYGFRFCIASQQQTRILNTAHNPGATTSAGNVLKELGLLRRWPAGGGFHLERHELGHAIYLAVTDQIGAADAQASMKRAGLANNYIAGLHNHHPAALDLRGLPGPTRADVVAPEPGVARAAGQENALLYSVF
jgi:hypothetical protein